MTDSDSGDPRRAASEELARLLARPEGQRLARLLQRQGTLDPPRPPGSASAPPPGEAASPRAVSLWRPEGVGEDGAPSRWVRPEPLPSGDHYAARRVIEARRGELPRRICFFGESAAAGYLYAPHLTPAGVLEEQLQAVAGVGSWEVVDLARTNERLETLAETVESSLQLHPDLLVVYAGNNWNLLETPEVSPLAPSVVARQEVAEALRAAGLPGLVGLARRRLAERAERALERVAVAARSAGLPVVVVIPEVNLADWETRQPAPWLPGRGVARWYAALRRGVRLLRAGDRRGAEEAAWEMVRLDGSSSATPFRLLARAWQGEGRSAEARDAALAEVDAVHYPLLAFLAAPQATTAARDLLAGGAARHGLTVVDLRSLFARWTGSPLPGRRLFLDYCHLTREGMKVAMAGVATRVLEVTGAASPGWEELARRLPDPEVAPEAEAVAFLGAAVHTAHRRLPVLGGREILEHWCREALRVDRGIAGTMLDLAAARAVPRVAPFTAAADGRSGAPRLGFQHGLRWPYLDGEVLGAMGAVLEEAGLGAEAAELEARLVVRGGVGRRAVDLVHPPAAAAEPLARFFPEVLDLAGRSGRAVYRVPWPEVSFFLVGDAASDLELEITARLPPIPGLETVGRQGRAVLAVEGRRLGVLPLGKRWKRASFRLPRELLRFGASRLSVGWSPPPPVGEEALAAARRRLEEGVEAELHPVFGEIFSLRVRRL